MSDHHAGCHCTSCSPAPTGDKLTEICECVETTQDVPDMAPVLSAEFWEQPEIRSALLSRHFGCFLRTYRTSQSPQVKQTQLARWLGITQGQLSRIERSATPICDLAKLDTWAQRLHIPPDQLWFSTSAPAVRNADAPVPQRATVEMPPHSEASDIRRRDLLKAASVAAATAGAGLLSDTPWQRLIDSVNKGRPVDTATVQLMQDRTADLFHTEESVPARQLLDAIAQHRTTLETLLANARIESIQRDLVVAMGETDVLTGWLLFDLGRGSEASNAWRSTLKIAKETGDRALAACALGYWSYLASSRNDTAPAVRLLQQARDCVPGSSAPATRSWLSAREAEELARLGDENGALRAVERALTAYDFARPRSERPWTAFFGASRLGSMTVSAYTTLRHRDATAAADSLLTSLSPMENKVRAIVLSDLTINAAHTNDYDRATALVSDAIELTTRTETTLAKQRLLALAATLPATASKAGSVGVLREQIVSTLRG
ncbi:MAG TPA: helix-turn-helix transcriptional regulator [Pseudonocardiaceae bacterium]